MELSSRIMMKNTKHTSSIIQTTSKIKVWIKNYEKNIGIDIFLIQLRRNQYFLMYKRV